MARTRQMQALFMAVAVIMCLGAFASSASAYSLTTRGCTGAGGGTVTKALTDWNFANLIMPARSITRAPSSCSTYGSQRIVVQYRLLFLSQYYPYNYQVQAAPSVEGLVGPGGSLSIPEAAWGGTSSSTELSVSTPYRTEVRVWWERPSNRAVYGYKIYYSNYNSDYSCSTINTINGNAWCGIANGAVRQFPGIWLQ